jgi:hypothetical protein
MKLRHTTVLWTLLCAGCATIVGDKTQLIQLNSTPDQAAVTVSDERGQKVFSGRTPTTVVLPKSDGSWFGGKTYHVRVENEGFKPVDVTLETRANGWYIAGNLVFGGLIGWLVVDPLTGAMYNIAPEQVNAALDPEQANYDTRRGALSVLMLQEVPASLRDRLLPVR